VVFVGFIGVALALVALVVDGGEYFFKSREAQNAADAGALAGALQLCPKDTDAHRATCEDKAESTAADYAQAKNMTDGTPTVTLLTKDGAPVSASNPYTKVRVQISADAPLFFADLLGVSSTKAVGRCRADDPDSVGQCAIAAANQDVTTAVVTTPATTTTTPGTTTTTYPDNLFAFVKGDGDASKCETMFVMPGSDNVFNGQIWSNESFSASGKNNGADLLTTGTGCTPGSISDDKFPNLAQHDPVGWPVAPPALVPIGSVPCIAGGKLATSFSTNQTWRNANPPGIYCASSFNFGTGSGTWSGYTWVANNITTSSGNTFTPSTTLIGGRRLLFYALSTQSNAAALNGGQGIHMTGDVIVPNGGLAFTGSTNSAVDGFVEVLNSLSFSGSGTVFTGSGPSPEPITTTTPATTTTTPASTTTVTTPGDVSVGMDW
jgi:Flp pilus assembly protein TadG